ARALKVAQEYATRLLRSSQYEPRAAEYIARALTETYPEHSFSIFPQEAKNLGLRIEPPPADIQKAISALADALGGTTIVGTLTEVVYESQSSASSSRREGSKAKRKRSNRNRVQHRQIGQTE